MRPEILETGRSTDDAEVVEQEGGFLPTGFTQPLLGTAGRGFGQDRLRRWSNVEGCGGELVWDHQPVDVGERVP